MDNITHSLLGLALGQAAAQSRREPGRLRVPLWITAAVASNFPDLDFVYANITSGKLGYLLHHRGHTHTLVAALPIALIILAFVALWAKLRRKTLSRSDWLWLGTVALVGPLVHIFLDYTNSYGVHPFWPFDNRWYFGDSIFIVEPWLWVSVLPSLIFAASSRAAKWFFAGVLALALSLCFLTGFVPWQMALIVAFWAFWLVGLMYKISARAQIWAALAAYASVTILFFNVSANAREKIQATLDKYFPQSQTYSIAMTPLPANPFCWNFSAVQSEQEALIVRRGIFAPFSSMLSAAQCPKFRTSSETTAPLTKVEAPPRPEVLWDGQFSAPKAELAELYRNDCGVAAIMRFIRVPFWKSTENGMIVGDLRFDRSPDLDFAEMVVSGNTTNDCPKNTPPWEPSLTRLLHLNEK